MTSRLTPANRSATERMFRTLKGTSSTPGISRWTWLLMRSPHWSETLSVLHVEGCGHGALGEAFQTDPPCDNACRRNLKDRTPKESFHSTIEPKAALGEEILTTATIATRPRFLRSPAKALFRRCVSPKMAGTLAIRPRVALAYAIDSRWRNRSEFINGRSEIIAFLSRKWAKELDYRLIKEMWAFTGNRIALRFAYEWHDDSGHW